jgi:mono/diheme cytochrome c family protein
LAKTFSKAVLVVAASMSFGGCTQLDNAIASVPYLAMMRNAPFFDPYEAPLNAPPGSIPFSGPQGVHLPPLEPTDPAISAFAASPYAKNPYAHGDTAVLAYGQKMFERHCSVCHNKDGRGNGPIVGPGKFPMGPSLITPGRSEGYVYGIIRAGRGVMPSYGARTSHNDRWAIATYVAHLQEQAGAVPAAVPAPAAPGGPPTPGTPNSGTTQTPVTTTTNQTPAPAPQENR